MKSATTRITGSSKPACSHRVVDDLPELATNEVWRGIMRRARDAHELTQGQLATAVGRWLNAEAPSQVVISRIESGSIKASKLVVPICDILSIPRPEFLEHDDDRAWVQLGRLLRAKNVKNYDKWKSLLEDAVGAGDGEEASPGEAPPSDPAPNRK